MTSGDDERYNLMLRSTERLAGMAIAEVANDRAGVTALDKYELERLDRYQTVMRHEFDRLRLNPAERTVIDAVLKETRIAASMILSLDSEIIEAASSPSFVKRFGCPPTAFIEKLRSLSPAQKYAIIEAFERGVLTTRYAPEGQNRW